MDRKAYQADYYWRNKDRQNARRKAARRKIQADANGVNPKAAAKLTSGKAAKAIADWSGRKLVAPAPSRQGEPFQLTDWQVSFLKARLQAGRQGSRIVDNAVQWQELPNRICLVGAPMRADTQGELAGRRSERETRRRSLSGC